jgi:hypothetical protein
MARAPGLFPDCRERARLFRRGEVLGSSAEDIGPLGQPHKATPAPRLLADFGEMKGNFGSNLLLDFGPANGSYRRVLVVAARSGECPFTKPTTVTQA